MNAPKSMESSEAKLLTVFIFCLGAFVGILIGLIVLMYGLIFSLIDEIVERKFMDGGVSADVRNIVGMFLKLIALMGLGVLILAARISISLGNRIGRKEIGKLFIHRG